MKILTQQPETNYQLLDSGNGYKLERYGNNTIVRPDSNCVWSKALPQKEWDKASALFNKKNGWQIMQHFKQPWLFTYHLNTTASLDQTIVCELRASLTKNIGIFPEQSANWAWMSSLIANHHESPQVLNLFGYTGMASIVAAASGAQVCHVDASQSALTWGKQNQAISKLTDAPIRWIAEDCTKFVTREIKRGNLYDGIILDPPAFGRDQKGKIFEFEKHVYNLLGLCKQIIKPKPLFFIFNGYSMGYSATVLKNLLLDFFPDQTIEFGELQISEKAGKRNLPCSLFARFTTAKVQK